MEKLLSDNDIREFITNGFLRLVPDIDSNFHKLITNKIRFAVEEEGCVSNNIVSRVPELWKIIRSPCVHGAITSLLGKNYYVHPHRAVHISRPITDKSQIFEEDAEGLPMGNDSNASSNWHQDAHSPLARARSHTPKYLVGFYFPQETPQEMGPTRIQAGSYLYSHPVEPSAVVLSKNVIAGTFFLLHFDTVHAAFPNRTDIDRYMIKFVFTRTQYPNKPSWYCSDIKWKKPKNCLPRYELTPAWNYIWNWMAGRQTFCSDIKVTEDHYKKLNSNNQSERLISIYEVAKESEIFRLGKRIEALSGKDRDIRELVKDEKGETIPRDKFNIGVKFDPKNHIERRWNERAIVFDDAAYALAAIGPPALKVLDHLLTHEDPWVILNAVFALGEIGPPARSSITKIVKLLDHELQQIVRQALDALIFIGGDLLNVLPKIQNLLRTNNPNWQESLVLRGWNGEDQVRLNAAFVLLSGIYGPTNKYDLESTLKLCLGDKNGYVAAVSTEALIRIGTPSANQAAIAYLQDRRWDDTLLGRKKPF